MKVKNVVKYENQETIKVKVRIFTKIKNTKNYEPRTKTKLIARSPNSLRNVFPFQLPGIEVHQLFAKAST